MTAPHITSPTDELDETPSVRSTTVKDRSYIQVLGLMHEPVLDLTCTEALNLAMRLVEEAGNGLSAQLAALS